jgi:hypothetical protein
MRDINALKRTRTFLEKETNNSIRISNEKLSYYCYIDIFKDYIKNIPYYFGNSDVFINVEEFEKIKKYFVETSLLKYKFLEHLLPNNNYSKNIVVINNYFKDLLGEHYVD